MSWLPIVVMSSAASEKSQRQAFELGADDYIVKTFRAGIVVARINALFRRLSHRGDA